MRTTSIAPGTTLDPESQELLQGLKGGGRAYDDACARLHELLLRAARFEVSRRGLRGPEADGIATEAADDALLAVLRRLDDFRGLSKLTTWAYKFALYEAAVKVRRQAWKNRELPVEPETLGALHGGVPGPEEDVEIRERLGKITAAIDDVLTPHQRRVLVALAVNGVPIDVLADRLSTTRGALYKTLHDARAKLRAHLEETS
ncbi:MAG TPA: sigma-70 family RNA polymerase sigma factor [Gaiellaceae bacterium]|nr:sigma-70 family RNA polymerase sigma factor [Gaiellaceae bacterium]